jgi:hypothetical protein
MCNFAQRRPHGKGAKSLKELVDFTKEKMELPDDQWLVFMGAEQPEDHYESVVHFTKICFECRMPSWTGVSSSGTFFLKRAGTWMWRGCAKSFGNGHGTVKFDWEIWTGGNKLPASTVSPALWRIFVSGWIPVMFTSKITLIVILTDWWSGKDGCPANRFMTLQDGHGLILKLWGSYSPK